MDALVALIEFVPLARELEAAVKATVEGAALIFGGAVESDHVEPAIPSGASGRVQGVERLRAELAAQVEQGLVAADEGCGDANRDAAIGGKAQLE